MRARWPIVVVIAIAGAIAWFALRGGGDDPPAVSSAHASDAPEPVEKAVVSSPQPPMLYRDAGTGSRPSLQPALSADAAFAAESRDTDWAPSAELEIRKRFKRVRGAQLAETECRQSQCRIVVSGTQSDVSKTIADLEGDRGLHGFARNLLLTAPERRADGTLVLRAFALFDR